MLTLEQLVIALCSLIHITEMAMVANPELQKSMGAAFYKQVDFIQGAAEKLNGDVSAVVTKIKNDFAKLHPDVPPTQAPTVVIPTKTIPASLDPSLARLIPPGAK